MNSDEILKPWPQGTPPAPDMCSADRRTAILSAYGLDALEDDPELAQITAFAAEMCAAPIALVSLVEEERQRFLARAGLEERETPRPTSFCAHAMLESEPMVIPDAMKDGRFETNPLVKGHPYIRFYAGAPLVSHEGAPLGSLCVIDTVPRPEGLTDLQHNGLKVLAQSVMRRLRHRREHIERQAEIEQSSRRLEAIANSIPDIVFTADAEGNFEYFNDRWYEVTGLPRDAGDGPGSTEAFLEEEAPIWRDKWYEAVANGMVYEVEYRLRYHDGHYRWVLARALPMKNKAGTIEQWFGTLTDIDDARRNFEKVELLSRELSHRIKNIFAVVTGLISIRARRAPEAKGFAAELNESIRALSRAHDFVRPELGRKGESLKGLLTELLAPYGVGDRVMIEGEDSAIGERAATPLALVFHELGTNSAKYGALSGDAGRISVRLETLDDGSTVRISWQEHGIGPDAELGKEGFGSQLVRLAVEGQLHGTIERARTDDALVVEVEFPAASILG